ncbi:arginine N-succinyltransferase [Sphingorhabdus wooponensis]|jgi:arginine N-succinyltransferase|uniref:Arginine N-succinyltransferase n=1 Tax=Sphingorhabdus wooponensis TaxID=940136 RepID=A0A3R8RT05_9SPHN|nr:arginine N-succinyltransferase [Sphingorhabdus wooponensis]RRQ51979.1 arginine N-succinyltransferase [Sphingorhabdus wooponensis]
MTFLIRPANMGDLQPIYEMAKRTGGGFTNLPPDKKALSAKLERSAAGFDRVGDDVADDLYVFVLQNSVTGEVRGTCQIFGKVGQRWPFYSYRIGALTQHSVELERTFRADILNLSTDLEGATEVGGLFLHPGERAGGLGMLIARSRYLFIRNHRQRFADRTIAELRGVIDEAGGSPFWDGVAGRFFGMSFQEADEFNAKFGNQFIADLMPKHPVYIAMLQESAKTVIGVPHPSGRAAMRMLENEGFAWENYIDIFDGGPTMTARTDQIRSIREAKDVTITEISPSAGEQNIHQKKLFTIGRLHTFKAAYGWIDDRGDDVIMDTESAQALNISVGDQVTYVERS